VTHRSEEDNSTSQSQKQKSYQVNSTVQSTETWLKSQELVIMNCRLSSDVVVLNGTIDNWPAQSLLDSGASEDFLTRQFVDEAKIPTTQIQSKPVR
jgi:hypothetical protein